MLTITKTTSLIILWPIVGLLWPCQFGYGSSVYSTWCGRPRMVNVTVRKDILPGVAAPTDRPGLWCWQFTACSTVSRSPTCLCFGESYCRCHVCLSRANLVLSLSNEDKTRAEDDNSKLKKSEAVFNRFESKSGAEPKINYRPNGISLNKTRTPEIELNKHNNRLRRQSRRDGATGERLSTSNLTIPPGMRVFSPWTPQTRIPPGKPNTPLGPTGPIPVRPGEPQERPTIPRNGKSSQAQNRTLALCIPGKSREFCIGRGMLSFLMTETPPLRGSFSLLKSRDSLYPILKAENGRLQSSRRQGSRGPTDTSGTDGSQISKEVVEVDVDDNRACQGVMMFSKPEPWQYTHDDVTVTMEPVVFGGQHQMLPVRICAWRVQQDQDIGITLNGITSSASWTQLYRCCGNTGESNTGFTCVEDYREVPVVYQCQGGQCPTEYKGPAQKLHLVSIPVACICKNI
ncbi:uncharacterized protein LOC106172936 [Lingula anatina]|uniref:Uncharacterized protein LOC106172936 n=1 Tax=Lingula anatina TaxID=7574 RepID=A0A1S3JG42_LINAN|nr:uncharacterized protein LOC106172936 [Lingula anatina]|eukprot:XP_013409328.1 uncharacterized protein LOC106172936 [Lingula anatina]